MGNGCGGGVGWLWWVVVVLDDINPLSPGVLDPGNYPGGVLRTHSYILPFLGFFMPPSINVKPHMVEKYQEGNPYWVNVTKTFAV